MKNYQVAVVGATGLVGRKMIQVLEERRFPVGELRLLASPRSAGRTLPFNGKQIEVEALHEGSFAGIEISFWSAGGQVSKDFAPHAVKAGSLVIDNSSAFRMDDTVPLVVPEVNPHDILTHKGIIANPNCSTIQMVVALKPLHDRWKIRRIVVATYQSVTGAGKLGQAQLEDELERKPEPRKKFPHPIAYNVLPQIDIFFPNSYSREEIKMVNETQKIMGDPSIRVTATCARVPVVGGHSEAVNVEFEKNFEISEILETLKGAPGVCLQDDVGHSTYPMPIWAQDKDEVFVGRVRRDESIENGLNLWIVSDNLRKGAATNAVQIAEAWIQLNHPHSTRRS
jgi:aspartate-semialdehyde dehydrogenase